MSQHYGLVNRITISAFVAILLIAAIVTPRLYGRVGAVKATAVQAGVTTVNSASYSGLTARGSIVAAFGTNLATMTASATSLPLPTNLAGTSVTIVDANGTSFPAPLFFVSALQVNYLIPNNAAVGAATVTVVSPIATQTGSLNILNSGAGIFTANASGTGVAAASVSYDGGRNFQNIFGPMANAVPVIVFPPFRPTILSIFGTGFQNASNVSVNFGGIVVPVTVNGMPVNAMSFAGAQGQFLGLDQINVPVPSNVQSGMVSVTVIADNSTSNSFTVNFAGATPANQPNALSVSDVQTLLVQAAVRAQQLGRPSTIAVVDREGNPLGVFQMNGAPTLTTIVSPGKGPDPDSLINLQVPSQLAAISKAGTAAFFSTNTGSAISSRTASFIVQEHLPPGVPGVERGALFGVQFSQLPCSDVRQAALPLGLAGDPGSAAIYKNGQMAGGIGVESDGIYSLDLNPNDDDQPVDEDVAVAGTRGFEAPTFLRS
ncbi:MAG TPA: hypothetical protein VJ302_21235, partial [Blastocatellia bacterium]|nr:hypothetical protein [Blastocatellia bacterium]